MTRARRSATWWQQTALDHAFALLLNARDSLKGADCPKTLARVRAAISSAKGARRNMRARAHARGAP